VNPDHSLHSFTAWPKCSGSTDTRGPHQGACLQHNKGEVCWHPHSTQLRKNSSHQNT